MSKKKAIIGLKNIHLAEVKTDTDAEYTTLAGFHLPAAGQLSRTPKTNTGEVFYDDELYDSINDTLGEEAELRVGELSLTDIEKLGLGELNSDGVLETDFSPAGKIFSLRCETETSGRVPYFFKWRNFKITDVRFDNFKTSGSGMTVAEGIIKGMLTRPRKADLKPHAITQLKEDGSNQAECTKFLKDIETTVV